MEAIEIVFAGVLLSYGCALPQSQECRMTTQTSSVVAPVETGFTPLPAMSATERLGAVAGSSPSRPPVRLVSEEREVVERQAPAASVRVARVEPRPVEKEIVPAVIHVDGATFERHVLRSEVPVLVDFYASWCGPCKVLAPRLEEVAAETPRARVVKVNIDDSPDLADRYGVESIPSVMVFKEGRIVARQSGVASKARLKAMLDL
jgi:thioredoxin 1